MPISDKTSPSVTPRLILSQPADNSPTSPRSKRDRTLATRQASSGPRPAFTQEHRRSSSSEWIDIDDKPKRKKKRRTQTSLDRSSRPSPSDHHTASRTDFNPLGRFFPKLGQIRESNEATSDSRTTSNVYGSPKRRGEHFSSSRRRYQDDASSIHRRSVRHRSGGIQRRTDSGVRINPSLLSVLSGMTGNSDKSSGSNSTITQKSFDRTGPGSARVSRSRPKLERNGTEVSSTPSGWSKSRKPNVFDYMQPSSNFGADNAPGDVDGKSIVSDSTASSYASSEGDSSEMPETPSSRSTFPSPTGMKTEGIPELRKPQDGLSVFSDGSRRGSSRSPALSSRSMKRTNVSGDHDDDEEERSIVTGYDDDRSSIAPTADSEVSYMTEREQQYSGQDDGYAQWHHGQMLQDHNSPIYQAPQPQRFIDPLQGQHRSFSSSSQSSDYQAWAAQMAMQQYQLPTSPHALLAMATPQLPNIQPNQLNRRPSAPAAPDLTRQTIQGYEKLAVELVSAETQVKPLYRKFEYLNHRILLHLQDELCELEEQLRTVDEIIAQMSPPLTESEIPIPASRRSDAIHGAEIHRQRTSLLGKIFIKTEQYNRAMSSYTALCKDVVSVQEDEVDAYRKWMASHRPIHELETKFLDHAPDLMLPGKGLSAEIPVEKRPSSPEITTTTTAIPPQPQVQLDWRPYLAIVFLIGLLAGVLMRG